MTGWKRHVGILGMVLVLIGMCSIGVAQININLPWAKPGAYSGNAIDFGAVLLGQTKTVQYTFKILETSDTGATVTITRPNPPFGSDAPTHSFTLAPGQSITFNVTFTPPGILNYTGSFTITAQGGHPVQTKKQTVTLTGEGVVGIEDTYPPTTAPPTTAPPTTAPPIWTPGQGTTTTPDVTEDVIKLEAKLDTVGKTLDELRQKLDNLGWWLGKLTAGFPLGIEPHSTNPIPETNIWELLAKLEAKLDRLAQRPSETTAPDINITIIEIYNIIVEINQLIINLGGNVAGIETKLDRMSQRPSEATAPDINITIIEIHSLIIEINQLIINLGGNVDKFEAKLDELSSDLKDLWWHIDDLMHDIIDTLDYLNSSLNDINSTLNGLNTAIGTLIFDIGEMRQALVAGQASLATAILNAQKVLAGDIANLQRWINTVIRKDIADTRKDIADTRADIAAAQTAVLGLVNRNNNTILANANLIKANTTAINGVLGQVNANGALIQDNSNDIQTLMNMVLNLQESNNRVADKLNQQLGYPGAPDHSKITLGASALVGEIGAVDPNSLVTVYWPTGDQTTVTAGSDGSFSVAVPPEAVGCSFAEVTQTDSEGKESARVIAYASP